MTGVLLTVACYTVSSLGDKHISAKLKCSPAEFAFIVSFATMIWIGLTIPFVGWSFSVNMRNCLILISLVVWKILEFYTSALLLKTVSAYELKAWLGINIAVSYLYNVCAGIYEIHSVVLIFTVLLVAGIVLIVSDKKTEARELSGKQSIFRMIGLSVLFIFSKFMYGLMFGKMTGGCKTTSVLLIVMFLTALLQLLRVKLSQLRERRGMVGAAITRIPNAAGLILEAFVAMESIFLYAMIQPVQLAILFAVSLMKRESMSRRKLMGSLLCIISVCAITAFIYL